MNEKVRTHPLELKCSENGSIVKIISKESDGFKGFSEVYFSIVGKGVHRPFKRHLEMTLNLVVIEGCIEFSYGFDLSSTSTLLVDAETKIRLEVPPKMWLSFKGVAEQNKLMNVANLLHDENEIERYEF